MAVLVADMPGIDLSTVVVVDVAFLVTPIISCTSTGVDDVDGGDGGDL